MSNLVVVAIPEEQDRVWKISSEQVPHMTLLFLGEEEFADIQQIMEFVEHAVTVSEHGQFYATVDRRGTLGEDDADVIFFKDGWDLKWVKQFRNQLLQNQAIKTAYDSTDQYEGWTPHLTLGYPETPAKPMDDDAYPIHSVCFDRIAVWADDYNGPEFRLEWPERELDGPLAVAYSDTQKAGLLHCEANGLDAIEHFGTKGMRWGVRNKDTQVTVRGKSKMVTAKKAAKLDKKWEKGAEGVPGFVKFHNSAAEHVNARIDALNASFDKKYPKEMKEGVVWNESHPIAKEYAQAHNKLFKEGLDKAAASMGTSPSGKFRVKVVTANNDSLTEFNWSPTKEKIEHADMGDEIVFQVTTNSNGLITKVVSMDAPSTKAAHSIETGAEFIEHFGVKGMKWGVIKEKLGIAGVTAGRGLKKTGRFLADSSWEASIYSSDKHNQVHNKVAADIDSKVFKLQDSPKYRGKNLKADKALETEYHQDVIKVTDSAYRRAVKDVYGSNYTGTKSAHYVDDVRGARIEIRDTKTGKRVGEADISATQEVVTNNLDNNVRHAEIEEAPDITIPLKLDKNGLITGLTFVQPKMIHSMEAGEEFILEHFGIKGMHWGQRKEEFQTRIHQRRLVTEAANRKARPAKDIRAYPTIGSSKRQKSKVDTKGGEDHPPTEDAIKVAVSRQKLRKSGVHALSNAELREVANRLNLEQQVANLETKGVRKSMGRQFVDNIINDKGNQKAASRFAFKTAVKKSAKLGALAAI